jgi:branched-subunit amino acid ABC-type transport system permease component
MLLVLRWLLVLWGVALIVVSLVEYKVQADSQTGLSVSGLESALNSPSDHMLLIQQATTGLVAIGLSFGLLYLRRRTEAGHQ